MGYFFARELLEDINVPIGLINTSRGGTHVETWISKKGFEGSEEFRSMIASMGKINLDSMHQKNQEAIVSRIERLQGSLNISRDVVAQWKEFAFDDSSWPKMNVPGFWEGQAVGHIDGVIWFRKTFSVTAENAGREATFFSQILACSPTNLPGLFV